MGGLGDVNPTVKYAIRALQHRRTTQTIPKSRRAAARNANARLFITDLVKDRVVAMGASRVTDAVVRSHLASSLNGGSIQGLLRQMYDTPFGRSVIHHISGEAHGSGGIDGTAAVLATYEKIGTNAIASVVTMLLRCGWDLMEVLMGKKQWRDFWRSFVIAAGSTAGGIIGWTAGAGVGGSVVAAMPCLGPGVASNMAAVCAFLGTMIGDYAAGAATAKFVDWFMAGPKRGRGARGTDGRKRERSGEGRSSRDDGPRRPLPRRAERRLRDAPYARPHDHQKDKRDKALTDGRDQTLMDRRNGALADRTLDKRDTRRAFSKDRAFASNDKRIYKTRPPHFDSDTDSDEISSDSTYDSARYRKLTQRPRSPQRPDSYIRHRHDSYMQDRRREPKEVLLLKEHESPVPGGVELRRERRLSGHWEGEVAVR